MLCGSPSPGLASIHLRVESGELAPHRVDPPAHRVYKFSSSGRGLTSLDVDDPSGIAVTRKGHVFVLDRHSDQILEFVEVRPKATITAGPADDSSGNPSTVTFQFKDNEPSVFQCKLDTESWRACTSPQKLRGLSAGGHLFQVRSIDAEGLKDKTPAHRTFRVGSHP